MLHTLQTKDSYHCFDFDILTSSRNPNTNLGRFHGILRDFDNKKFIFLFVHVSFFGGGGESGHLILLCCNWLVSPFVYFQLKKANIEIKISFGTIKASLVREWYKVRNRHGLSCTWLQLVS